MEAITTSTGRVAGRSRLLELSRDLLASFKAKGFWLYSTWIEVLLAYRSTVLGPLWIVIGTAFFVFVVGALFKKMIVPGEGNLYIIHLAVGYVLWQYIQKIITKAGRLFHSNRGSILNGIAGYTSVALKDTNENIITLIHNTLVIALAFLYSGVFPTKESFLLILTVPLVLLTVLYVTIILAILGARYSDLTLGVRSIMRLMFFLTPILWVAGESARGPLVDIVLYFNPFYYLVEVVRAPLAYGHIPYFEIAVVMAALPLGWLAASLLYARTKPVIALWL